jgi:carboxylesterase
MQQTIFSEKALAARGAFAFDPAPGNRTGLLCIHGFTGTPYEMRPLGQHFAARGWRVSGVLLPGHGELPEKLKGYRWRQWLAGARDALHALQRQCDDVYIAGLSMGGLLTLALAHETGQDPASNVRAVAAMAAPAGLYDRRTNLVRYAHPFVPWFKPLKFADFNDANFRHRFQKNFGDMANLDDPQTVDFLKENIRIPLGAVAELLAFNRHVLKLLPQIRLPVYIAQGRDDRVVAADSADVIGARLGSARKTVRWYDGFNHEMPLEDAAPALFDDIGHFFTDSSR